MTRLVVRLEDAAGNGVFQSIVWRARITVHEVLGLRNEPDPYRHPGPDSEGGKLAALFDWHRTLKDGDRPATDYYFGFKDAGAAIRWFDSEAIRVEMDRLGARMVTYAVPPEWVVDGEHQLVFVKELARKIADQPIPTLSNRPVNYRKG